MSDANEFAEDSPEVLESEQDINLDETTEDTLYDDDQPDDETEGQDEAEEDDSEEVDFNDKTFKLPKDIAEGVKSMRKDYTEKTMALAEQRKSFESKAQFHKDNIADIAKVVAIDEQLKQYNQVNWSELSENDPVMVQKLMIQQRQLESQRNELAQALTRKEQEMSLNEQQEFAKRIEASETVLKRDIKDWSPELETKLQAFAVSKLGFDESDVKNSKVDPRLYKLLNMAYMGSQMLAKQASKPKVVTSAKPVTNLTSKGAKVTRDPSQMSDSEFAAWRRKTIQKRGA